MPTPATRILRLTREVEIHASCHHCTCKIHPRNCELSSYKTQKKHGAERDTTTTAALQHLSRRWRWEAARSGCACLTLLPHRPQPPLDDSTDHFLDAGTTLRGFLFATFGKRGERAQGFRAPFVFIPLVTRRDR